MAVENKNTSKQIRMCCSISPSFSLVMHVRALFSFSIFYLLWLSLFTGQSSWTQPCLVWFSPLQSYLGTFMDACSAHKRKDEQALCRILSLRWQAQPWQQLIPFSHNSSLFSGCTEEMRGDVRVGLSWVWVPRCERSAVPMAWATLMEGWSQPVQRDGLALSSTSQLMRQNLKKT